MPVLKNPRHDVLIQDLLRYEPETGRLYWRVGHHRIVAGQIAGSRHLCGYWSIVVARRRYLAHRIAWFLFYGEWPISRIDHINGDGCDNRIKNLRLATNSENLANGCLRSSNTSGFKGVSYIKAEGRWRSSIMKDGKQHHLGRFDNPEAAHNAYLLAAQRLFGEFARAA
ncbi:MAG TPA: HNH endonuclease [Bryobacteraceae bacterium]|nr:HNH endonuclease [Bryobacteraceae bacterium]